MEQNTYEILTNDEVRPEQKTEKKTEHLIHEAPVMVTTGTVNTAHILSVLTFHVFSNPNIVKRIQAELATLTRENQPWPTLRHSEKLPFLVRYIYI